MPISRRKFLSGVLIGGGMALSAKYISNYELPQPTISRIQLKVEALPANFVDYRIAFLTDIHHGHYLSKDYLDTMVNSLNKEHLDLVILGGDYIWIENSSFAKALVRLKQQDIYKNRREAADLIFRSCADCLGQISNKDGIIAVLGNHDRWEAGDAAKDIFQQYNLILGINTSYTVTRKNQNLEFILVDDYWTGFSSVRKFSLNKNKDSSRIIISHNPDFISKTLTEDKFRFDLALCGHTHGGQVKIPGVGPLIKNIRDTRFMEGLVTPEGKACQVYTSRGIGMVEIPLRIDCPPEITIFTLTI